MAACSCRVGALSDRAKAGDTVAVSGEDVLYDVVIQRGSLRKRRVVDTCPPDVRGEVSK